MLECVESTELLILKENVVSELVPLCRQTSELSVEVSLVCISLLEFS